MSRKLWLGLAFVSLNVFAIGSCEKLYNSYCTVVSNLQSTEQELILLRSLAVKIERLEILDVEEKHNDLEIFNPKYIVDSNAKSLDELNGVIFSHYQQHRIELSKAWNIKDEELLVSAYLMNTVHGLWAFGNKVKVKEVGCVHKNENGTFLAPNAPIASNLPVFLNSKIGCCLDQAKMLKILLTRAGIKNRYVANSGHVFNEIFIAGKWIGIDSTVNFIWSDDWNTIQQSPLTQRIGVMVFPSSGTSKQSEHYRKFIGQFRTFMLLEAVYKLAKDVSNPPNLLVSQ